MMIAGTVDGERTDGWCRDRAMACCGTIDLIFSSEASLLLAGDKLISRSLSNAVVHDW